MSWGCVLGAMGALGAIAAIGFALNALSIMTGFVIAVSILFIATPRGAFRTLRARSPARSVMLDEGGLRIVESDAARYASFESGVRVALNERGPVLTVFAGEFVTTLDLGPSDLA